MNGADQNAEGLVRTADVTVSVDASGKISFDDTNESIDFRLSSVSVTADAVTIDIQDDYRSEQEVYSGSYDSGKELPAELSIDLQTGQITGTIPDEMIDEEGNVEFEVSAYNDATKETRILKIIINVKELENAETAPVDEVAYIPLSEQLAMQNDKINNYGNDLSQLFAIAI